MCKKILIAIIFFVIFGSLGIGNTNQFKMIRHKNFLIKYKLNGEKFALKIVSLIDENFDKMEAFYRIKPNFSVNIIIVESADEFKSYSQSQLPDWTGAAYLITQDVILLKTPTSKNLNFKRDFLHELSHFFFHKKFNGENIPLWYNEGLAEYLSGKSIDLHSGLVLSNAIWAKTIVPFKEIDSLLLFSQQKAELAYVQSLSAVLFIKEKLNDPQKWSDFQEMISENGWTSTLTKSLNMDEIDFEISWYRHIEDKYRWLFILNVENLIWVILFIVLALGMYLIRNRNRKLLKKWEAEEQMYGYENFNTSEFESDYSDFYTREE
jgi:hypothetical protein